MTAGPRIHTALVPVPGAIDQDEVAPLHASPDPTPWMMARRTSETPVASAETPLHNRSSNSFKISLRVIMGVLACASRALIFELPQLHEKPPSKSSTAQDCPSPPHHRLIIILHLAPFPRLRY
ncbi:hypothetical protein E4U48_001625 [Claviceps purpurea]|nr:hypothetical protein E4U37_003352 [Claviceps purpurea]KAG6201773.1 hypothetical protein E4U10_004782 [Claviceps purpurea]KAG6256962.1 hypothetical protein E4U23_000114 [Claviceps purpurea]KAG6276445.1 hypothetical protein E4U48_001625 [Claviceps purpurea]